jgi:hypothetical protein
MDKNLRTFERNRKSKRVFQKRKKRSEKEKVKRDVRTNSERSRSEEKAGKRNEK